MDSTGMYTLVYGFSLSRRRGFLSSAIDSLVVKSLLLGLRSLIASNLFSFFHGLVERHYYEYVFFQ